MKERINSLELKEFLMDFEKESETVILEEGKEKDDIIQVANAKGINLRKNTDLAGFKTVFTFAEKANKNGARLPKKQLLRSLPSLIGKPVDIDHIRNMVVGHYIDYRFRVEDNAVIAYGVFYKSNFGKEWEEAKKLFQAKKLGTSFEIWCPQNKRKQLSDGTYELCEMEIAGGGLMFKEAPAFKDAKVLELAKKNIQEMEKELVFASEDKYKKEELITADYWKDSVKENFDKLSAEKEEQNRIAEEQRKAACSVNCQHCNTNFEKQVEGEIKCPQCFSILKSDGSVQYPPQIVDFKVACPTCRSQNWRIVHSDDKESTVKCMDCSKAYNLKFSKPESDELLNKIAFVYSSSVNCPQCANTIGLSTTSDIKYHEVKCPKCKLAFDVNIEKIDRFKQIEKISEAVEEPKKSESSEEGGEDEMKDETKTDEQEENTVENKDEETKTTTEVKVEESPKSEETKEEQTVKSSVEDKTESSDQSPAVSDDSSKTEEASHDTKFVNKEDFSTEKSTEALEIAEDRDKLRKLLTRAVSKIVKLKKESKLATASVQTAKEQELAKIKQEAEAKIELIKANAKEVVTRQAELGEFEHGLSDKDILDDDKFAKAKLEKENVELKAKLETSSDIVSIKKSKDDTYFNEKRAEIDQKAFGHTNTKEK